MPHACAAALAWKELEKHRKGKGELAEKGADVLQSLKAEIEALEVGESLASSQC